MTGGIVAGSNSTFHLFGTGPSTRPEWDDPAHRIDLPTPLSFEELQLSDVLDVLRERRVLVVECLWSEHQLRAAAAVVASLGLEAHCARGEVKDDRESVAIDAPAAGERRRFGLEDLEKTELGNKSRVLLLELGGTAGRAYLDDLFASAGRCNAVTTALRRTDRYLILLPRSDIRTRISSSLSGHTVPRLGVPCLKEWLRKHYPADATTLADLLRRELVTGNFDDERASWEWLQKQPDGLDAAQFKDRLTQDPGLTLDEVGKALECCDDRDLPFLTTVFVATYLPSLPQHDFAEAVRSLLGNRTRLIEPANTAPGAHSATTRKVALAAEWQRIARSLWSRAGLAVQSTLVTFRAPRVREFLHSKFGASPLFLDEQLEHVRNAGLLFHPRKNVSEAVVDLLASTAARDPNQLDASWLLTMISPHLSAIGATATGGSLDDTQNGRSYKLACALKLLRRLLDITTPDRETSVRTSVHQAPAATPGQNMVRQVIESMMGGDQRLAKAGLTLAFHLRNAPGFDPWRWFREAADPKNPELYALTIDILTHLADDPMEGPATLRMLFRWLANGDSDLNSVGKAVVQQILRGFAQSLRPAMTPDVHNPMKGFITDKQRAPALVALMLAQLPGDHRDGALELDMKVMLSMLGAHVPLEEADPADLARLVLPRDLLAELPEETHLLRVVSLGRYLQRLLAEGTAQTGANRSALRLALILAGWYLAHPLYAELWRAAAIAAAQVLGPSHKLSRRLLAMLRAALLKSMGDTAGDPISATSRHRWITELRVRRHALAELSRWIEPEFHLSHRLQDQYA